VEFVWDVHFCAAFREGHPHVLETVYWTHVDRVARVARAVLRSRARAITGSLDPSACEVADVVQEAFAKAFAPEARRRFHGRRPFAPYLLQIARHVAVDSLRSGRRNASVDIDEVTVCLSLDAEAELRARDDWIYAMTVVERYTASLAGDDFRVHHALYVKGLSQREAAAQLGLGRQAIRTAVARLRAGLTRELARAGLLEAPAPTRFRNPGGRA
jgi:RNA polymerase sigma factor (sigma-70 family)